MFWGLYVPRNSNNSEWIKRSKSPFLPCDDFTNTQNVIIYIYIWDAIHGSINIMGFRILPPKCILLKIWEDIVRADVSFLIGIHFLDEKELLADNLQNEVICKSQHYALQCSYNVTLRQLYLQGSGLANYICAFSFNVQYIYSMLTTNAPRQVPIRWSQKTWINRKIMYSMTEKDHSNRFKVPLSNIKHK